MKRISALALAALMTTQPALAEDTPAKPGDMSEGIDLLGEGARLFLKGLANEMEPALQGLSEKLQPAITQLLELIDDFDAYEMPERLPNGDIIIRRKPDAPLPEPGEDGKVDI